MTNQQHSIDNNDSQTVINQLVLEYMREQKRKRFWTVFKRCVYLIVIAVLAYWFLFQRDDDSMARTKAHVGIINIKGAIADNQAASFENLNLGLSEAYANKMLKALILSIDSPGGSPVQADDMYQMIRFYRTQHPDVKIYAVCGEMCTSAAYYIAAAADEIYANQSSLVGSIGVIYNGFGFVDTLQKVGVTRRLITAGTNKGFLDQFSPVNPAQEDLLQTMLNTIHERFIEQVKAGRGERLHLDDTTFSGLFWTGMQAKEMGLIDGFSNTVTLTRDVVKIENTIDYTNKENLIDQVAKNMGASLLSELPKALGLAGLIS